MYKLQPNGAVRRLSDQALIPADPGNRDYAEYLAWAAVQGNTPDPHQTLAERREAVWMAIKAERDRRKSTGALAGGNWFHTDADSRIQQLALVIMGASVMAVPWKTLSGSFVTMSQTVAGQIFTAVATLDADLFANAEALRAAVNASSDPESVDITAGWPQNYEESLQ